MVSKETHTTCEVMAAGEIEKNVQHHVLTKTELPAGTREWTGSQKEAKIDQFRYIKIQSQTIDFRTRLWGINPTNSVFIPQSLVLRSIVWGWILMYQNWSIQILPPIPPKTKSMCTCTRSWLNMIIIFMLVNGIFFLQADENHFDPACGYWDERWIFQTLGRFQGSRSLFLVFTWRQKN